jgi:nucleotide-binding universal stress UspA family protein
MTAQNPLVVVGVDGSAGAHEALLWAAGYVRATDGTLTVVGAWNWPTYQGQPMAYGEFDPLQDTKEIVEAAAAASGLPERQVRTVVAKGGAAKILLDVSEPADLLVIGSRGHGGFAGLLLGSVSTHCVHHATCPVVVVRPQPDRESGNAS